MPNNHAIILAGGIGSRMNSATPKQFITIDNYPIIYYSIKSFALCPEITSITVVCHSSYINECKNICFKYFPDNTINIIAGGNTRQESSYNGLRSLTNVSSNDLIFIHDAARPFISNNLIKNLEEAALLHGAVVPAIPVTDTILQIENNFIKEIPSRETLRACQTPQVFSYQTIMDGHNNAIIDNFQNASDDSSLILRLNKKVAIVTGETDNIKVTNPQDIFFAEKILQRQRANNEK